MLTGTCSAIILNEPCHENGVLSSSPESVGPCRGERRQPSPLFYLLPEDQMTNTVKTDPTNDCSDEQVTPIDSNDNHLPLSASPLFIIAADACAEEHVIELCKRADMTDYECLDLIMKGRISDRLDSLMAVQCVHTDVMKARLEKTFALLTGVLYSSLRLGQGAASLKACGAPEDAMDTLAKEAATKDKETFVREASIHVGFKTT